MSARLLSFAMTVLSISLMSYGIVRKRKDNAGYMFVVGSFFLSCIISVFISDFIGSGICAFLNVLGISAQMQDGSKIATLLVIPIIFIFYRVYLVVLYWESRPYISTVYDLITLSQSNELPDCTKNVLKRFRERILYLDKQELKSTNPAFAQTQL